MTKQGFIIGAWPNFLMSPDLADEEPRARCDTS